MMLERMALRSEIDKFAAYFYIPVDEHEEVQRAQYEVLDALNADLVTLEPQEPDRLHVSLLFIERVRDDDLEEFFNKLNLIMPVAFNLEVVRTGTFKEADEKPLVLFCAAHPALLRLQQELYDTAISMGLPVSVHSKPKFYTPHISIAYNYMPQDIKIPDLTAPFKIPIYNFVCTRNEYELTRTIHLPNYHNEEVLVTRLGDIGLGGDTTPTGQSGATTPRESDMSAGSQGKREKDRRVAEMVAGDSAEPTLPKEIRLVYTPDLDIECRQTRSREFVDIELGPPFWDIGDRGLRAGALAFQIGNILADEMIMGLGGPHEWARADAMLQAPPKEQEAGFRYIFGTNAITWAASYAYASFIINGPEEMASRGYHDGVRWIEIALEQLPEYEAENMPDYPALVDALGDFPPDGVSPHYLIGKGGEGSGHHGHKGRPGEVGGSLPEGALDLGGGMMAVPISQLPSVSYDNLWEINTPDFRFEELREETEDMLDFDMLDVDDATEEAIKEIKNRINPILIDFTEDVGHAPRDIIFTDHIDPVFEEYWGDVPEEHRDEQWREVAQLLYGRGTKATYTGNEDYPDNKKIIHLNVDLMLDEYDWAKTTWAGGELDKLDPSDEHQFRQAISHELGHWLTVEADTRRNPPAGFGGPSDEYKVSNRIFDEHVAFSEYQADLVASMTLGDMGFRGWGRDLTEEEIVDRDLLMAEIDKRMRGKPAEAVARSAQAPPIIYIIPWGDGYEGIFVSPDQLSPDTDTENLVGVVQRGGEGSGHHGHEGREGEVGGSLPSGATDGMAVSQVGGTIPPQTYWKSPEYGKRVSAAVDHFESVIGKLPSKVKFISDDLDAVIEKIIELDEAEGNLYTDEEREKLTENLQRRLGRVVGANIPADWGKHIVVYMNEELSTGEHTFTGMDEFYRQQERTVVAGPEEVEYVISHELGHALMKEPELRKKVRYAYLNMLDEKYPHRMEEVMIPRVYRNKIGKLYKDMSDIESEYFADMIGYAVRLQADPDNANISVGGDRAINLNLWNSKAYAMDEKAHEVTELFLGVINDYYKEGGDA